MAAENASFDPMHQFEIVPLIPIHVGGLDLSYTNSSLWMTLALLAATALFLGAGGRRKLVPTRLQLIGEALYEFVAGTVRDFAGKEGMRWFPAIFSLFLLILLGNLLGMVPYSFTFTSHIVVTFTLAALVFLAATAVGFFTHGLHYLKLFVPEGMPVLLLPLVVPIEIISYLSRPVSLSVRLFANMLAGHAMLKIFAGFSVSLGVVFGLVPLGMNIALTGLEFLVAVLQAYVFTVLSCLYLGEALRMH